MTIINIALWIAATAVPLLAIAKLRDLWRRRPAPRGKYSAVFSGYGAVFLVENKSFWWVLTGRS